MKLVFLLILIWPDRTPPPEPKPQIAYSDPRPSLPEYHETVDPKPMPKGFDPADGDDAEDVNE